MQERGLPGREKEGLVLADRPADGSAEIVEIHSRRQKLAASRVAALERVAGAEIRVAVESVRVAMELVGARLQHDVDHGAAGPAPFRRQTVVQHGKFGY